MSASQLNPSSSKGLFENPASRVCTDWAFAKTQCDTWKKAGEKLVFTNGCFDLLHVGHVTYLAEARTLGTKLIVGINSDASVRKLKGASRPIQSEYDRATILAALRSVDLVVVFSQDTPLLLIEELLPHVLVKGGDYKVDDIVGAKEVLAHGGEVKVLSFVAGKSTSAIVARI